MSIRPKDISAALERDRAWRERSAKKYGEKRSEKMRTSKQLVRSLEQNRRNTEVKRFNRRRLAKRKAENLVYGTHHKAMARFACVLIGSNGHVCGPAPKQRKVCGHHLKTVATGGEDRNNEVPVCGLAHLEFHAAGSVSVMCNRHGKDFRSMAVEYTLAIDRGAEE